VSRKVVLDPDEKYDSPGGTDTTALLAHVCRSGDVVWADDLVTTTKRTRTVL